MDNMSNSITTSLATMAEFKCEYETCRENVCHPPNGICCSTSGISFCMCAKGFTGQHCEQKEIVFDWINHMSRTIEEVQSSAQSNITILAVFLGLMALLLTALLAVFIVRFSRGKKLLLLEEGEVQNAPSVNSNNSDVGDDADEANDDVDGIMLLRPSRVISQRYHPQISHFRQNSRTPQWQRASVARSGGHSETIREGDQTPASLTGIGQCNGGAGCPATRQMSVPTYLDQ